MSRYLVRVIDQDVYEWTNGEGEGDHLFSKGGFEIGNYASLDDAKTGINEFFGYALEPSEYSGEYLNASIIENGEGYADENGNYCVNYTLVIEKIDRVIFEG